MNSKSNSALGPLLIALQFAAEKHRNQRRKDVEATPYINHPIAVASVLAQEAGVEDAVTLQAAILHDTLEDTDTSYEELVARFGVEVADVVAEVTDNKSIEDKGVRKGLQLETAPRKSARAAMVKLADKTCNLRDLVSAPPAEWDGGRKLEYFEWARKVVDRLPAVNVRLMELFDAAYARGIGMLDQGELKDASV
jgi:guanosine-3',5'-bis(diphosphate) 3'-pyrophosphohydrolase